VKVKTQAELDAAIQANDENIEIVESGEFSIGGNATVQAWGNATVQAGGNATVQAWDNATVQAWDNATVQAGDNATVRAWGNATVQAWGNATVQAWGNATVQASRYNAVTFTASVKVTGGVQIKLPVIKTVLDWCEFHGLNVVKDIVTLYKAVDAEFKSPKGCEYKPGTMPEALDWDGGKKECGGGLHFSPQAFMALKYNFDGKRFVACPVAIADIRAPQPGDDYPDKVKAKKVCAPCYEVDIDGKRIEAKGGKKECGGGLHFSPQAFMAWKYNFDGKRFVACPVAIADIRAPQPGDDYPDKVKAKKVCAPCYEVDIDGKRIEAKGGDK
jgi:hypothetical protein